VSDQPTGTPQPVEPEIVAGSVASVPTGQPHPHVRGVAKGGFHWGTGRRKTAVARVRIRVGDGKFLVNEKEVDTYFSEPRDRKDVRAPLVATGTLGKFDVYVNVNGGGPSGQAGAVLLGIARALCEADQTLEHTLRDGAYMTRDSRMVERKKYGQSGARRRFQFSKR
jgi:small subunit ribosomal protein S9